jgi:hypothetical protein
MRIDAGSMRRALKSLPGAHALYGVSLVHVQREDTCITVLMREYIGPGAYRLIAFSSTNAFQSTEGCTDHDA